MATAFVDRRTGLCFVVNDADADAAQTKIERSYPDSYFERVAVRAGEMFRVETDVEQRITVQTGRYDATYLTAGARKA